MLSNEVFLHGWLYLLYCDVLEIWFLLTNINVNLYYIVMVLKVSERALIFTHLWHYYFVGQLWKTLLYFYIFTPHKNYNQNSDKIHKLVKSNLIKVHIFLYSFHTFLNHNQTLFGAKNKSDLQKSTKQMHTT